MMLTLLLLAAADPETAVDAERAFYRSAQAEGQWTAFRKFMVPEATLFVPQPSRAEDVLPAKNPPIAVQWWPAESYVSCDGSVAVNTGPWVRPKGSGYFTTVWERQPDGRYKWSVDGGDELAVPRALPEQPQVRRAACKGLRGKQVGVIFAPGEGKRGQGVSHDGTLAWAWRVMPDGSRTFTAKLWNGRKFETVVRNEIAAPPR
jgi:hypothetical protein